MVINLLLILILIIMEMATDIYSPSLPEIKSFFKINEEIAQLTITVNLLGIAISGCLYGPLSDSYGRKKFLLAGVSLFLIGSFLCSISSSIHVLIFARFIQGLGQGVAWVLALAVVGDLYKKRHATKVISILGMVISASPAFAPLLGGVIAHFFGWRMNFIFLSCAAMILLICLIKFLPETLQKSKRHPFSCSLIKVKIVVILKNKVFLNNALISGLVFSGLWSFIATAPFVFNSMNVDQISFGLYNLLSVASYGLGSLLNHYFHNRYTYFSLMRFGIVGTFISGSLLLFATLSVCKTPLILVAVMGMYSFSMAFIFANATSNALHAIKSKAATGTASSIISFIEMVMAIIMISGVGAEKNTNFYYVSIGFIVSSILCVFLLKKSPLSDQKTSKIESLNGH